MEKIESFKEQFDEELKSAAYANNTDVETELLKNYIETLIEIDELDSFVECYFNQRGYRNKALKLDGYSFDEVDKSFSIFIVDYCDNYEIEKIGKSDIDLLKGRLRNFLEQSLDGYIIENFEASSKGYEIADYINGLGDEISKFNLYIISNRVMNEKIKNIKEKPIMGIYSEVVIWDLKRMFNIIQSNMAKETIEIKFSEFKHKGLPYIKAVDCGEENYTSYLTTIPGNVLADIYIRYGARLLEGNVRSFLSVRGKVNKQIRNTIHNEPEMFFAYNNGIAATATRINVDKEGSDIGIIESLVNFQIINGGQTTASIANAVLQDKKDVSKIMVPVKLSIVNDKKAEEMVPIISRCANSQNKVDEADFFANHPYHIKIEEFSRKVYAPSVDGNQYQTIWFYERARGQHTQEQMKLTVAQKKAYLLQKPKSQIIKKVDLAKYINSYEGCPHIVSKGAQTNMRNFAEKINKIWSTNSANINKFYYQKAIALAIIFKSTETLVSRQEWYQEIKSYRANIVTYSIAVIFNYIKTEMKDYELDFMKIWNKQKIYKELESQLIITTKEVYDFITRNDRGTLNVTEWCKKDACWIRAQKHKWTIQEDFLRTLISGEENTTQQISSFKEQKLENTLNVEMEVIKLGTEYWKKIYAWAETRRILTPMERDIMKIAMSFDVTGKIPTYNQCRQLLKAKAKIELEGFKE